MPAFEHLSVLVSIVVGMAVSQVLFGLGQLVRRRGSYKVDPLYILTPMLALSCDGFPHARPPKARL